MLIPAILVSIVALLAAMDPSNVRRVKRKRI